MMVFIQKIETRWTKQSRGGELAQVRNAIPEITSLPKPDSQDPFSLHVIVYNELDLFKVSHSQMRTATSWNELELRDLDCCLNGNGIEINFRPDQRNAARLPGSHVPRTIDLKDLEWGQIAYNARYVGFSKGDWWYGKVVYNIGICTEPERVSQLFQLTPPKSTIRDMRYLR